MFHFFRSKIQAVCTSIFTHRKWYIGVFLFIAVLGIVAALLLPVDTWAAASPLNLQGTGGLPIPDFVMNLISRLMLLLTNLFLSLTLFILTFVIEISGYNGYLSSPAVNYGWVMIRDLTNMGFVIMLLLIAFGTILGVEHYEWKKMLTKLVLAAILVNFSRTICGVFIDVAQVVMNTFVNGIAATAGGNLINAFNLQNIKNLSGNASAEQINASGVFLASIAAVFFSATVMATMAVFFFMLLARVLVLWILIVLSPAAFVLSVIPQTEEYAHKWWKQFGANVITGPVLLFFVWLAFVTVGNGDIHNEIYNKTSTPQISEGNEGGLEANKISQATGIGDAMGWNNMANFAIAIGMLLAGAKTAAELGGVGASWAEGAVDFGKKAAYFASGAFAARWAGEKTLEGGKELGKFALMKAPLGGEFWQRQGRTVKGKAKNWWTDNVTEPRIRAAGEHIDTLYGKHKPGEEPGTWEKLRARAGLMLGSSLVKDDIVKALEEGVEKKEEALEHVISTSKTPYGQLKQQAKDRLKELEDTGHHISEDKSATEKIRRDTYKKRLEEIEKLDTPEDRKRARELLMAEGVSKGDKLEGLSAEQAEKFIFDERRSRRATKGAAEAHVKEDALKSEQERREKKELKGFLKKDEGKTLEHRAVEAQAEVKQRQEELATEKELEELKAIRKLLASEKGTKRQEEIFEAKAKVDQIQYEQNAAKEVGVARARDEYLRSNGRQSEAVNLQNVMAKQQKERVERQSVGDYVLSTKRTAAQLDLIADLKSKGFGEDSAKMIEARKSLAEMGLGNLGRHAAFAEGNKALILGELGMDRETSMEFDMSEPAKIGKTKQSLIKMQSQLLSSVLGKTVTATKDGIKAGREELKKLYENDEERVNSVLEQLRLQADQAAGQGSVGLAGLLTTDVDEQGRQTTKFTDFDEVKTDKKGKVHLVGLEHVKSRRTNALSGAKVSSLAGGFSGSVDRDATGNAIVKSGESKEILVKLLSPTSGNMLSNVDEFTKTDLADVFDNSSESDLREFLMEWNKKATNKQGMDGLINFAADRMGDEAKRKLVSKIMDEVRRDYGDPGKIRKEP